MCMRTKLIDGTQGGDSDYVPLLITSTDDLVLPLNAEESSGGGAKSNIFFTKRLNRETFARFLDTLTRTFCLPLLGQKLFIANDDCETFKYVINENVMKFHIVNYNWSFVVSFQPDNDDINIAPNIFGHF